MRILNDNTILDALRCPYCKQRMNVQGASIVCSGQRKHCFDFGGRGYINFGTPSQSGGGDSKEAVRARSEFLNLNYYSQFAEALTSTVKEYISNTEGIVIDAGCGEGYYSERIAREGYSVCGFDLSKFAVDYAAKRANLSSLENAFFAVASVFSLPVQDACADAVINVFAPCAEKEYFRVLKNNGILIVASAGPLHLMGLKRMLYPETHENKDRADMPQAMEKVCEERVCFDISVQGNDAVRALFGMTPYYWRTSQEDAQKLDNTDKLDTEIDILISVYKKSGKENI